jgi:hypothetical protein
MLGISAGFASNIPVVALIGSLVLFVIATPVLIYNKRLGLVIALISLLLMLPYTIGFAKSILDPRVFNWRSLLALLPALFTLLCTYLTVQYLFFQTRVSLALPASSVARILLAFIPVTLIVLYFIFFGKAWF